MQQTEFYYLNKIERGDTFSPEALNENAESAANLAALADFTALTEAYTRAKAVAGLDQRVTALEVKKVVVGTYVGSGGTKTIELGFTPLAVFAATGTVNASLAIPDHGTSNLAVVENGFQVNNSGAYGNPLSTSGRNYFYVAFG